MSPPEEAPYSLRPSLYRRLFSPKRIEIALWITAAAVSFSIYFIDSGVRQRKTEAIIEEYRLSNDKWWLHPLPPEVVAKLPHPPSLAPVIFGAAFLLIPLLCRLIFNALPIEMLRYRVGGLRIPLSEVVATQPSESSALESAEKNDYLQTDAALLYLRSLAKGSRQIAEKIYLRAGVYLLIGVLVAFSGLAFFYYQQAQGELTAAFFAVPGDVRNQALPAIKDLVEGKKQPISSQATSTFTQSLLHTLPRFGILFFIETIAFFFLRQYRTAMDEYRYFEAIKRRREENFVLLSLLASPNPIDLTKLPQQTSLYSDVAALAQGQTTDLLESRKLNKEETAILEKVVDAITKIKP